MFERLHNLSATVGQKVADGTLNESLKTFMGKNKKVCIRIITNGGQSFPDFFEDASLLWEKERLELERKFSTLKLKEMN